MRATHFAFACAAIASLAGCVSTNATVLDKSYQAPSLTEDQVRIYRTASQVPYAYREIAILNSAGDANYTTESLMAKSMRARAAKLGANGIILDGMTEPSTGAQVVAAIFGTAANRKGRAVAILTDETTPRAGTSSLGDKFAAGMTSKAGAVLSNCKVDASTGAFYDCVTAE
jgi:hypothetical protein